MYEYLCLLKLFVVRKKKTKTKTNAEGCLTVADYSSVLQSHSAAAVYHHLPQDGYLPPRHYNSLSSKPAMR